MKRAERMGHSGSILLQPCDETSIASNAGHTSPTSQREENRLLILVFIASMPVAFWTNLGLSSKYG